MPLCPTIPILTPMVITTYLALYVTHQLPTQILWRNKLEWRMLSNRVTHIRKACSEYVQNMSWICTYSYFPNEINRTQYRPTYPVYFSIGKPPSSNPRETENTKCLRIIFLSKTSTYQWRPFRHKLKPLVDRVGNERAHDVICRTIIR